MATDIVQAVFSGAAAGSDLSAFAPSVGSGLTRHPVFSSGSALATGAGRIRVGSANTDTVYYDTTAASGADYKVRAKLTALALSNTDIVGPTARCASNSDNFYTFAWVNHIAIGAGVALFKHVNGASAQLGSLVASLNGTSIAPVAGMSAVLEIAVVGSTITGSFNGVPALTVTDSDLSAAGFGGIFLLSGSADDGAGIQMAEFFVNDPSAASGSGTGTGTGTGSGNGTNSPPAPVVFPVTSSAHWCSPLNWDDDGTGAKRSSGVRPGAGSIWSANPGAEGRFAWTTSATAPNVATLGIDTSGLIAGSIPPGSFPKIKYRINDGAFHVVQLQPGTGGAFAVDVSGAGVVGPGTYTLRYILMATSQAQPRWTPVTGVIPPNSLKVTGLTVDAGSTPVAPAVLGKTLAVFGDSITEGVEAQGTNNGDLASNDATLVYARALAAGLGAELAAVGFGGQGWEHPGGGGVAPFSTAFGFYSAGRPRDFSPAVDIVVCTHGTNDGLNNITDQSVTADSAAWLASARAKFGNACKIFLCVPFGGFERAALSAGFEQYQAATPDPAAFLIDGGPALEAGLTAFVTGGTWAAPGDGIHPDAASHARIASTLNRAIDAAVGGTGPGPMGSLMASGVSFARLRSGGLTGQLAALIAANPALDAAAIDGLRAGSTGTLDKTYQGLATLVESYLRGDPIATTDINVRLGEYATVFAGYAQSVAEIASLAAANPGTVVTLPTPLHAINPVTQRTFG